MSEKSVSLYYKDGGSDKVYFAQIEPKDDGFVVNFQYGRRGSTLTAGTKTNSPVSLSEAEKIFDKLVKEKTAKGYSPGEEGTPFAGTDKAGELSGLVPQLLNPIDMDRVDQLLKDDDWFMQEKEDGFHQMTRYKAGAVTTSNRKGLIVPNNSVIELGIKQFYGGAPAEFDGEAIGDSYHMFDLLTLAGTNFRPLGALVRFERLARLFDGYSDLGTPIFLVRTAITTAEKKKLFEEIKATGGEGVVFKKKDAPYVPGRPNSGGNMLKFKFKGSATLQVNAQIYNKRSVAVFAADETGLSLVPVGNVTIPSNWDIPELGAFVEVEYLYAFPGGSLFQAVYKGPRSDKDKADLYSMLKFKQGTGQENDDA